MPLIAIIIGIDHVMIDFRFQFIECFRRTKVYIIFKMSKKKTIPVAHCPNSFHGVTLIDLSHVPSSPLPFVYKDSAYGEGTQSRIFLKYAGFSCDSSHIGNRVQASF